MKERKVGTKGKSPKQGLTSAKDLPMELPERHEYPYNTHTHLHTHLDTGRYILYII